MTTYAEQAEWRRIQEFLPAEYQLTPGREPAEEWWDLPTQLGGHRIHLDTYRNPDAPVKVILFHGVGTNGRQMSLILGRPLADRGYETVAIDMPTYGVTQVAEGALVTYDDWVRIGSDLVEKERDGRPIVLYGLSAGGMETFHVAALNAQHGAGVDGIVGMTFLDTSSRKVAMTAGFDPVSGLLGGFVLGLLARTPLRRFRIPMWLAVKMRTLVNNKAAKDACYADRTSAGNSATIAFLASFLNYRPAMTPEEFAVCPVLLTQPAADRWTPLSLSEPFLRRITKVPVTTVMLENAGHYPLEQPGLDQMVDAIDAFSRERVR